MPTAAGQSRRREVVGRERRGEPVVQASERVEALEHLAVARGIGSTALDDVTAVLTVDTRGTEELLAPGERVVECLAEGGGLGSGEFVDRAVEFE